MPQNSEERWGSKFAIPYSPATPSLESPFTQNQRLIREQELRCEQEDTRAHFRRQIDEVEERKRKKIRVGIYPDPDPEPRPIPLDPTLKVTVAFKPGELKFSLMEDPSNPPSTPQPTTIPTSRGEFFEAEHYWSSISSLGQISDILALHEIGLSGSLRF